MRLLCRFGFHYYSRWDDQFEFNFEAYQNKTCKHCGKVKQRNVGWAKVKA